MASPFPTTVQKKQRTIASFFGVLPDAQARLDQHERMLDKVALQPVPPSPEEAPKRPVGRPPRERLFVRPAKALAVLRPRNKKRSVAATVSHPELGLGCFSSARCSIGSVVLKFAAKAGL